MWKMGDGGVSMAHCSHVAHRNAMERGGVLQGVSWKKEEDSVGASRLSEVGTEPGSEPV